METVELSCHHCGTLFKRSKRDVERHKKVARVPDEFYCSKCIGKQSCARPEELKRVKEIEKYITEHWLTISDQELAKFLKTSYRRIGRYRRRLGLLRRTRSK